MGRCTKDPICVDDLGLITECKTITGKRIVMSTSHPAKFDYMRIIEELHEEVTKLKKLLQTNNIKY